MKPELPQERHGTVAHVVFPTGIDRRDDLGLPDRFDVYYGMADDRIGVARLDVPDVLPPEGVAYKSPKITATDSPKPNIKNETTVIQVSTVFVTDFTSPSIGGLFFCGTAPVESLDT